MLSVLRILPVLFLAALAAAAPFIRTASNGPKFVVYHDLWMSGRENQIPTAADLKGFNVINLSFLMLSGAADMAQVWEQMSASDRAKVKADYAAAGISVMVSAFGSTDAPTSAGADPVATANKMAAWVKQYDLDGIDIDYEDFDAVGSNLNHAAEWLSTFTSTLRKQLPAGQYLLTHAPVAPWFSDSDGVYRAFDKKSGSLVDWVCFIHPFSFRDH
jgi:chitinase